jgi:hypothetical protein
MCPPTTVEVIQSSWMASLIIQPRFSLPPQLFLHLVFAGWQFVRLPLCFLAGMYHLHSRLRVTFLAQHIFSGGLQSRSSDVFFRSSAVCWERRVRKARMSMSASEETVSTPALWGMCASWEDRKFVENISVQRLISLWKKPRFCHIISAYISDSFVPIPVISYSHILRSGPCLILHKQASMHVNLEGFWNVTRWVLCGGALIMRTVLFP